MANIITCMPAVQQTPNNYNKNKAYAAGGGSQDVTRNLYLEEVTPSDSQGISLGKWHGYLRQSSLL